MILAHELAHARRRDLAWDWLGALTQVLFFFHPLVHIARREERLARESAADLLALQAGGAAPAEYGAMLLTAALGLPRGVTIAAVGMAEQGKILERRLITLKEITRMSAKRYVAVAGLTVLLGAVVAVPWGITRASAPETSQSLVSLDGIIARTGNDSPPPPAPAGNGRITGHLIDDKGQPHVGAPIQYWRVPDVVGDAPYRAQTGSTITDASGRYVIPRLAPGRYALMYYWPEVARGGQTQVERMTLVLPPGQTERAIEEIINLHKASDGRITGITSRGLQLRYPGEGGGGGGYSISPQGNLTGRIISPDGTPLRNARVAIRKEGSVGGVSFVRDYETNQDGRFYMPAWDGGGAYRLYAWAEGHEGRLITPGVPLQIARGAVKTRNLELGDITLGWATAHMSGRVVNPQGRGLPHLTVLAQGRSNPLAVDTTDSKGYFRINNLVPGEALEVRVFYDDPRSDKPQYLPRLSHFFYQPHSAVDVFAGGKIDRNLLPLANEIWHRSGVKAGEGQLQIRLERIPAPWFGKEVQSAEQVFGLRHRRRPKPE